MGEESLGTIYGLVTVLSFVENKRPKVCFPVPCHRRVFFLLSTNIACVTLGNCSCKVTRVYFYRKTVAKMSEHLWEKEVILPPWETLVALSPPLSLF